MSTMTRTTMISVFLLLLLFLFMSWQKPLLSSALVASHTIALPMIGTGATGVGILGRASASASASAFAWTTTARRKSARPRSLLTPGVSLAAATRVDTCGNRNDNDNDNDNDYRESSRSNANIVLRDKVKTPPAQLDLLAERMSLYFGSMVDPDTDRFFLLSYPQCDSFQGSKASTATVPTSSPASWQQQQQQQQQQQRPCRSHQHCPLRELGSAWDAAAAVRILERRQEQEEVQEQEQEQEQRLSGNNVNHPHHHHHPHAEIIASLTRAISQTIEHYASHLVDVDADVDLDAGGSTGNANPKRLSIECLREPPNIAHNGLLMLARIESDRLQQRQRQRQQQQKQLGNQNQNLHQNEQEKAMRTADHASDTSPAPDDDDLLEGLTLGILAMQRSDGAFRIWYEYPDNNNNNNNNNAGDDDQQVLRGIEFYPGEAMAALMEVFCYASFPHQPDQRQRRLLTEHTRARILPAMIRAFGFYRSLYDKNNKNNECGGGGGVVLEANYAIWQVQAFGRLALALREMEAEGSATDVVGASDSDSDSASATPTPTPTPTAEVQQLANAVSDYCADLCGDIASSPSWRMLSRGAGGRAFCYPNLSTIEIACGLDALVMGGLVEASRNGAARNGNGNDESDDESNDGWAGLIDRGIDFVSWSQDRVPESACFGYGGLGLHGGLVVTEQRLDATGHALSALSELLLLPLSMSPSPSLSPGRDER